MKKMLLFAILLFSNVQALKFNAVHKESNYMWQFLTLYNDKTNTCIHNPKPKVNVNPVLRHVIPGCTKKTTRLGSLPLKTLTSLRFHDLGRAIEIHLEILSHKKVVTPQNSNLILNTSNMETYLKITISRIKTIECWIDAYEQIFQQQIKLNESHGKILLDTTLKQDKIVFSDAANDDQVIFAIDYSGNEVKAS